jgi:hypothetical protein
MTLAGALPALEGLRMNSLRGIAADGGLRSLPLRSDRAVPTAQA